MRDVIKKLRTMFILNSRPKIEETLSHFSDHQPIYFNSIIIEDTTPSNADIKDKDFIVVKYKGKNVWALFKCPCGCTNIISLSLKKIHIQSWSLKKTNTGRPTISPSILQSTPCHSHFWIIDGRIHWFYEESL